MPWIELDDHTPDARIGPRNTKCRCTPERKEISHSIFSKPLTTNRPINPAVHVSPIKLNTLPREILHPILNMVYEGEERSKCLCHCSRPKTSYKTARAVSLEHRIVNTMVLRSVCRSFHAWALHDILIAPHVDGKEGAWLEVDFSNFETLKKRLNTSGVGLAKRLAEDFPGLVESGITMYLGSPGQIIGMRSIVEMLKSWKSHIFSGVSLWELDYFVRERTPEFAEFLSQNSPKRVDSSNINTITNSWGTVLHGHQPSGFGLDNPLAYDSVVEFCKRLYEEDKSLFIQLITNLRPPLSKLHLPLSVIVGPSETTMSIHTLASLTRGLKTIVLKEMCHYASHEEEVHEYLVECREALDLQDKDTLAAVKVAQAITETQLNRMTKDALVQPYSAKLEQWRDPPSDLLDAAHIEYYRTEFPSHGWSVLGPSEMQRFLSMFARLESVEIAGGFQMLLPTGTLLKMLLPHAQSLSSLIYLTHESQVAIPEHPDHFSDHFCTLLPQFPKLRKLDVEARICNCIFSENFSATEALRKLDWTLRIPLDTNPCGMDGLSGWNDDLIEVLLQHCREWHSRHEAAMGTLDWDIKIHMGVFSAGLTMVSPFEFHGYPEDVVFQPLAQPATAVLTTAVSHTRGDIDTVVENSNSFIDIF
jgi:hypothetical protein